MNPLKLCFAIRQSFLHHPVHGRHLFFYISLANSMNLSSRKILATLNNNSYQHPPAGNFLHKNANAWHFVKCALINQAFFLMRSISKIQIQSDCKTFKRNSFHTFDGMFFKKNSSTNDTSKMAFHSKIFSSTKKLLQKSQWVLA